MFTEKSMLVGVDIHRTTNVVQVRDAHGNQVVTGIRVANSRTGTDELAKLLGVCFK